MNLKVTSYATDSTVGINGKNGVPVSRSVSDYLWRRKMTEKKQKDDGYWWTFEPCAYLRCDGFTEYQIRKIVGDDAYIPPEQPCMSNPFVPYIITKFENGKETVIKEVKKPEDEEINEELIQHIRESLKEYGNRSDEIKVNKALRKELKGTPLYAKLRKRAPRQRKKNT